MAQQVVTELVIDGRAAKVGADQYSAAMEKASAATQHLTAANDQAQAAISRQTVTMTQSISRQAAQFGRLEAAVNPVIAAHQKLERATIAGNAALAKGIITQEQYNATLGKYKVQAEEASAASGTLFGQLGGIEGVLKGFGLGLGLGELLKLPGEIRDIVHEAAGLTHVAAAIGITTDRLQELQFAGSRVHVTTETMDAALEKFSRNLGVASQGTGDLSKILAMNHVKISGDVSKDFLAVANLVERATNAEQRNVIVTAAFGKNAEEMGLLFEHGAAGIEAAADEARKFGAVISGPVLTADEELDKRINDITYSLSQGFKSAVVTATNVLEDMIKKNEELSGSVTTLVNDPSWKAFVRVLFGGDDTGGIPKIGVINIPGHGITDHAPATKLPSAANDAAIKEAEHLRKQFDEAEKSTVKATNALLAHAVAVGQGVQAGAAYEKQQELLNLALQNHIKLSAGEIENINKIGEAYGAATLRLAEAKVKSDLAFQKGQIFRSPIEQNVAGALRDLYGDAWQKHADDAIAKQMRVNDELRTAKGYAEDFTQTLVQGLMRGDSLTATLADSLTSLSSSLASSAIKDLMGGNFLGAAVSGVGALISGILGKNAEEDRARKEARKAWADMAGDVADFSKSMRGSVQNDFTQAISDAKAKLDRFALAAREAGAPIGALVQQFNQFRANEQRAGRAAVLADISPKTEMSDYETELRRLRGARAESVQLLHELGMSLHDAVIKVNAAIRASVADLRGKFVADLQGQIDEATGHGVFNEIQTLIQKNTQQLHDAQILGVDASLVNQAFVTQAQALVDNERLTGDAFNSLIQRFPQLAGVVHQFVGTLEDAAASMDKVNGIARTIVDYLNSLRTGSDSTLSPQERLASARATYNAQFTLAQSGNLDAQSSITKYADDFLKAARSLYASSESYQSVFQQIQDQLIGLPAVQQSTDPIVIALRDAITAIHGTTDAVTTGTTAVINLNSPSAIATALLPHFTTLDTNVNGLLDFGELQAGLGPLATDVQIRAFMAQADLDANGMISKLELQLAAEGLTRDALVAAINAGPTATATALLPHFNTLDANVNGLLDVGELRSALGTLASDAQIRALITSVDTNGDGQISQLELVTAATQSTASNTATIAANTASTVANTGALHTLTVAIRTNSKLLGQQYDAGTKMMEDLLATILYHIVRVENNTAKTAGTTGTNPGTITLAVIKGVTTLAPVTYASHGGIIGGYAPGGIVSNGAWNVDSVRARYAGGGDVMLAGGEGVINAAATRLIGPSMIDLINRTGRLPANDNGPHFATQNRVLATGFNAVVSGLRRLEVGMAELRDANLQLERRARIDNSREPRRKTGTGA